MSGKRMILLAASILVVSLWGCSTDFDAENNPPGGGTGAAVVDASPIGAGNCIGCHNDPVLFPGATVVTDYLLGNHVIHSQNVNAASGDCLACHDPFGDGRSLENFLAPADIPLAGLAAVTCEACHGAGGDHAVSPQGLPVPYQTPDYDRCGQCHNAEFTHNSYHPEGDNILEDYSASKHSAGALRNSAVCVKCHTDEGARLYANVDDAVTLANTLPVTEASKIQCRTCHNVHNNGLLLEAATATGSAEYNTCTNCHQRHDATIGASITQVGSATDGASGELIIHAASWDRVISSTHYDDPATSYQNNSADQTTNIIEGYAIDPLNERACRDCHNVHGANADINKQWASSAHGSKIRDAKETAAAQPSATPITQVAAVRAAGANGADNALPHYDWDATYKADGTDADTLPDLDRGSCQMCHTATGAKNFLTDPANYDVDNNDFSHLEVPGGWQLHNSTDGATVSSGQNELIYCWACHSDNSGTLRNPGALTLSYTVDSVNPTLPDLGKTNVCINCHAGRGNMDSYALTGAPAVDMSTLRPGFGPGTKNVTATHYFNAAATIYQSQARPGYHYSGLSYADKSYYGHKSLGLNNDTPETGAGPCAACHMADANHSLNVVEKNSSGVITALKSTACVACHTGAHGPGFVVEDTTTEYGLQTAAAAAAFLEEEAEGFHEALAVLEQQLISKGLTFSSSYPYFSGASWINEGTFGAAHNYNYLHHEPGAYAHNRYYAKRLIFDSLDWLDNGTMNGTITINALIYPEADAWLGSGTARP